jgi:enoyl-CoA hydratase/carnithine racemase
LESGLAQNNGDDTIRALVLSGKGGCFASGADIKELSGLDEAGIRKFHELREKTFSLIEAFPSPTIALIERYALGTGLELALCCDFRIADEDARLGVPSARLGLVESYEYITRLVRAVGPSWAKKLIYTGERIDAKTALTIGLVEEIADSNDLLDRLNVLLSKIGQNSRYAIRESKRVVEACAKDPMLSHVGETALPMVESMKFKDFKEGTRAFLEKRERKFN